eukprot:TRINITY_DN8277_c0_g3_i1.p1 TRINITY_DN8277_c0_g3~~TRINITY_DN8277_c0_g3_i1.p1  ORF type:complete len:323 (-),score=75.21 TRINITY_DN8277_c0_g3_i1:280-1146(-)
MAPPPEISIPKGKCWLLKKSLYGLKQSPRKWNEKLHDVLVSLGFRQSVGDPAVYTTQKAAMIVAVYVDDLTIVGSASDVTAFKQKISTHFDMTDLGQINWLLGVNIVRKGNTFYLSQAAYVNVILERMDMLNCRAVKTPLALGAKLSFSDDAPLLEANEHALYREAVGGLVYLVSCTRPDLAFAMSALSQHVAKPQQHHLTALKHVLRYLKGSADRSLIIRGNTTPLTGYVDADFANDEATRRSVSGYVFLFGDSAIAWKSRIQRTVALSTTEAEYMAVTEAVKEALS